MAPLITAASPFITSPGDLITFIGTQLDLVDSVAIYNMTTGFGVGGLTIISMTATEIIAEVPTNQYAGLSYPAVVWMEWTANIHFYSIEFMVTGSSPAASAPPSLRQRQNPLRVK